MGEAEIGSTQVDTAERRTELLSMLAHELRNPLAPIRNSAELLRSLCTDPRQMQAIELIGRQVVHMTRLLDDLLDAARLDHGLVVLRRQNVEFDVIVRDALDAVQQMVGQRRQSLVVSLLAANVRLSCDPTRLLQVLQNLLNNANRFTPEGGTLYLKTQVVEGELVIEVADNGEGIEQALLPRIFNVFSQGHQPLHRPHGGLGMGLAIARNVVEMHGGTITAHSEGQGRGSRFVVRLPIELELDDTRRRAAANESTVTAVRVLIVDDNQLVAMSMGECFSERGFDVSIAGSAESALLMVDEFRPHAAVLDIGLPGMNGVELARELRSRYADLVLVAVSGYSPGTVANGDPALFSEYLQKPASPERIAAGLESKLSQLRQ